MESAIADAESSARGERLVDAQAALRRVATVVAKESPPEEIYATLVQAVGQVLGEAECALFRAEADATAISVAVAGPEMSAAFPVGARFPIDGGGVVASVARTGRACRIDDDSATIDAILPSDAERRMCSAVGCPIVVGERVWGVLCVGSSGHEPLPRGSQARLAQFGDLAATAIANAGARVQVERLADEQAALRRVATLVAEGAEPSDVFEAVAAEMEALLDADGVTVSRYEQGREVTVVAHSGVDAWKVPAGTRWSHEGENVTSIVRGTERPARMERYTATPDAIAQLVESLGVHAAVGAPIVVDGGLWGVVIASWTKDEPPAGTEERMSQFAELLETAIANADSRDQLAASRVRLLAASDEARRRVVRDLHDGAQQRLVHAIITLKLLRRSLRENDGRAESLAEEALDHAQRGHEELRELAHGILPSVLTHGGLLAGVDALVDRLDLPVDVQVPVDRFPAEIEASAYFVVAEALTNLVKHAQAARVDVTGSVEGGMLRIEIRDDGIGGADRDGHGVVGMGDRVTALGGRLDIDSPVGGGTRVVASLPLTPHR